jgi:DNA invertase Pin-like site-specific DNA recombinase
MKQPSPTSKRRYIDVSEVPLTQGKLNAVRAAFKAGITPSRIARQFGISQSNVRKALASDEKER